MTICITVRNMNQFSLSDLHFLHRGITLLISLERMPDGRWQAVDYLLAPSSYGVVGVSICLLQGLKHARLVHMAGRWAKPPLSVKVAPIAGSTKLFVTLSLPRMISCTVYQRPPLHLSDDISCRVPGIDYLICPFHRILRVRTIAPFLAISALIA
jgi:hypothetical protein